MPGRRPGRRVLVSFSTNLQPAGRGNSVRFISDTTAYGGALGYHRWGLLQSIPFAPQQAGGAQLEEGSSSGHEATRRMERPVASVQVSQETAGGGLPTPRPPATQALGLLCLCVQLLQVGTRPSCVG